MTWTLEIENIAGIREGMATIEPGANAIRGSNWQGKSSLLAALAVAMGTDRTVTEGERRGRVELETADDHVVVELLREDGSGPSERTIRREGDPYLDDERTAAAAELFAFLGEDNELRQVVRAGENLEALLTRPLDLENIDERIAELVAEREEVDAELTRAEDAADRLPAVEREIDDLEAEIDDLEATRADLLESADGTTGVSEAREQLSDVLAERDEVAARIDRLERSVQRTREKLTDRQSALDELADPAPVEDPESQLAEVRERHDRAHRDAELLQSVYAPTKRLLDEGRLDLITTVDRDLDGDTLACWTCGTDATRDEVEANLAALSDRVSDLRAAADEHADRVAELEAQLEDRRAVEREREDLEREISDLSATLAERETSLERAHDRLDSLETTVDELAERVDTADDRLTDVESDLKYNRARLADLTGEREELQADANQVDALREAREELTAEIADLRTRKEKMKRRMREAFEEAMDDVLDRFETGFEAARLTPNFELVVARDGRETPLSALSEGEVEIIGIVAALAGHEAYDVADDVPLMLLDELGGLATANKRTLVDYLESRVDHLVFTAYPEYEATDANTISPDDWTVVSRELQQ